MKTSVAKHPGWPLCWHCLHLITHELMLFCGKAVGSEVGECDSGGNSSYQNLDFQGNSYRFHENRTLHCPFTSVALTDLPLLSFPPSLFFLRT